MPGFQDFIVAVVISVLPVKSDELGLPVVNFNRTCNFNFIANRRLPGNNPFRPIVFIHPLTAHFAWIVYDRQHIRPEQSPLFHSPGEVNGKRIPIRRKTFTDHGKGSTSLGCHVPKYTSL